MFSIVTISVFMTAILFYFKYNEKLMLQHIIGMLLIVVCVVILSISKSNRSLEVFEPTISIMVPIGLVIVQACIYTFNTFLVRQFSLRGYKSIRFSTDFLFVYGICIFVLYLFE